MRICALEMALRCSCSLGEIHSGKCDAETVQEVTNDEKRLLYLRTGHNVADIFVLYTGKCELYYTFLCKVQYICPYVLYCDPLVYI